jgi:hypothetical protein
MLKVKNSTFYFYQPINFNFNLHIFYNNQKCIFACLPKISQVSIEINLFAPNPPAGGSKLIHIRQPAEWGK